jgi:hypothetical protein
VRRLIGGVAVDAYLAGDPGEAVAHVVGLSEGVDAAGARAIEPPLAVRCEGLDRVGTSSSIVD